MDKFPDTPIITRKPLTEEHKAKLRKPKGSMSEEHKAKLRAAALRYHADEPKPPAGMPLSHRRALRKSMKAYWKRRKAAEAVAQEADAPK